MSKVNLLESLYKKYHKKSFIHPDPLEFVLQYKDPADQEIAGIIASSLATGRVASILKAVEEVLSHFPDLRKDLLSSQRKVLERRFQGFKYRFYNSESIVDFLWGIKNTILDFGSLENCFMAGMAGTEEQNPGTEDEKKVQVNSVVAGMTALVRSIERKTGTAKKVLPDPEKGSAMKRLNMFLRWMVRDDEIDPGPWKKISASYLIIPLDTNIMQISRILGFTDRNQSDMKTALEITDALRMYDPDDPVRFDFSLSRLGIHPDLSYDELYSIVVKRE